MDSKTNYFLRKASKGLIRPILHNPPIRNTDVNCTKSNLQKANIFGIYLNQSFQPNECLCTLETGNLNQEKDDVRLKLQKKWFK